MQSPASKCGQDQGDGDGLQEEEDALILENCTFWERR